MDQEEFDFEIAKVKSKTLLIIAEEMHAIRVALEDIAESCNILREAAILKDVRAIEE